MSLTQFVPSRPLLRYLQAQISQSGVRKFCQSHPPYRCPIPRSHPPLLAHPPRQQCRRIYLARIVDSNKTLPTDHKMANYDVVKHGSRQPWLRAQKLSLWVEGSRPINSHTFIGVMSLAQVMDDYLGQENATVRCKNLKPEKTPYPWLLVPRREYTGGHSMTNDRNGTQIRQGKDDDLEEYLLIKPKKWVFRKEPASLKGRVARQIVIKSGAPRDYVGRMLMIAYGYIEDFNMQVEFHIKYSKVLRMSQEWMESRCGALAFQPEVIAKSFGAALVVKPFSDGREVVFIMKSRKLQSGKQVREIQKEKMKRVQTVVHTLENFEKAGLSKVGLETRKDQVARHARDQEMIRELESKGEAFEHILEEQSRLDEKQEVMREAFRDKNRLRRRAEGEERVARKLRAEEYRERLRDQKREVWKEEYAHEMDEAFAKEFDGTDDQPTLDPTVPNDHWSIPQGIAREGKGYVDYSLRKSATSTTPETLHALAEEAQNIDKPLVTWSRPPPTTHEQESFIRYVLPNDTPEDFHTPAEEAQGPDNAENRAADGANEGWPWNILGSEEKKRFCDSHVQSSHLENESTTQQSPSADASSKNQMQGDKAFHGEEGLYPETRSMLWPPAKLGAKDEVPAPTPSRQLQPWQLKAFNRTNRKREKEERDDESLRALKAEQERREKRREHFMRKRGDA